MHLNLKLLAVSALPIYLISCSNALTLASGKPNAANELKSNEDTKQKASASSGGKTTAQPGPEPKGDEFEGSSNPSNVSGSFLTDVSLLCTLSDELGSSFAAVEKDKNQLACYFADKFGKPAPREYLPEQVTVNMSDGTSEVASFKVTDVSNVPIALVSVPKNKFVKIKSMNMDVKVEKLAAGAPAAKPKAKNKVRMMFIEMANPQKPVENPPLGGAVTQLPTCESKPVNIAGTAETTFFGSVGCKVGVFTELFLMGITGINPQSIKVISKEPN